MFARKKALDKITEDQLKIYLAVEKHKLRNASITHRNLYSQITALKDSENKDKQTYVDSDDIKRLIARKAEAKRKCKKIEKNIDVISRLLDFKQDHRFNSFSEYITSQSFEDGYRDCEASLAQEENICDRILLPQTPDKAEVQHVLMTMGFTTKDIASITADYPVTVPRNTKPDLPVANPSCEPVDSDNSEIEEQRSKNTPIKLETH